MNYFLRLILFWLIFFALGRILFILFSFESIEKESLGEILLSFPAALRLDLTTIAYILIVPLLLFFFSRWIKNKLHNRIIRIYHYILIPAVVLITIAGIRLFHEWGSLINYRAMVFMFEPDSITGSVAILDLLMLFFFAGSFIAVTIFIFNKLIKFPAGINKKSWLIISLTFGLFIIIGTRGGIQKNYINETSAYYSDNVYLNNAATNPIWYLVHSITQASLKNTERFTTMSDKEAESLLKELFLSGETEFILKENIRSPNIVIIILESWSADLIERIGGVQDVTPVFDSLSRQGILFSDIYSSGFRTDQGIVSLFSGFPAQPSHSIIQNLDKVSKLPFMPLKLKNKGYESSFYYGGNINFSNMKSYLELAGFEKIYGEDHFKDAIFTNWGAHDEFVLLKQGNEIQHLKEPFISTVLTLSTHEPYDVPLPLPQIKLTEPQLYNRSASYTDYSIGKYFEFVKTQPWYNNTLFVLTADHGHRLPTNYSAFEKGIRHMPVLFFGEVIKDEAKGKIITTTGNFHDLPVTILGQLNIETEEFTWSKNLLSRNIVPFAYIGYEKGFGWVHPEKEYIIYLYPQGEISKSGKLVENPTADSILKYPKAYIQTLYKEFLAL